MSNHEHVHRLMGGVDDKGVNVTVGICDCGDVREVVTEPEPALQTPEAGTKPEATSRATQAPWYTLSPFSEDVQREIRRMASANRWLQKWKSSTGAKAPPKPRQWRF